MADERDGALTGSTLKETNSWGKVDLAKEQMVYGPSLSTIIGSPIPPISLLRQ